ncbi:virginiamycin B lyase [Jatrophihabitans endophyticus]|uniref:Virginiamycin B lyase n=1 Tax=Jatrophihabitans endophyticus TaxID=1206085 RepID=A0A1M5PU80_9ACTN|nr:hypothetical protein [Jatrophihabitans endophyticus]SHH05358.1 virginiamycin B lyase [Jatrophihabitans endophyticus]
MPTNKPRQRWRAAAAIAGAVMLTAGLAPAAHAAPTGSGGIVIKEFKPFATPASFPCEVALDNNGNLWTDQFTGNGYGKVDPRTGAVSEIKLPNAGGLPGGQNRGPNGDIWFVEAGGNALGVLHPDTETITTLPFPWAGVSVNAPLLNPLQNGLGIPFDNSWAKDGKIYFTLIGLNAIGSYDPTTKQWAKYDIPTPLAGPIAMEKGTGNTIAIAEGTANKIATFDVYTHKWVEYPIPTAIPSVPGGLTVSPDDKYIYFPADLTNQIGRIDVATGKITMYDLLALRKKLLGDTLALASPLPNPGQMRFGSDGKLYFVEGTFSGGGRIGQLDVATSEFHEYNTPTPVSLPCDLNNTVPGRIYFGEFAGNRIGYFDIPNTTDVSNTYPLYG